MCHFARPSNEAGIPQRLGRLPDALEDYDLSRVISAALLEVAPHLAAISNYLESFITLLSVYKLPYHANFNRKYQFEYSASAQCTSAGGPSMF